MFSRFTNKCIRFFQDTPQWGDAIGWSIFLILVTLHPHYMHGRINIFEVGLYLPGIQSVLEWAVPFRDFFHLRGPLELYMPALLMKFFGVHIQWLYLYFYVGTILCMTAAIFIAKDLFKTRTMLYCFVPVFIGRTFPRVVFTYWGGMRYAFGMISLWFVLRFFKKQNKGSILWAGVFAGLGFLTSVEVGIYVFVAVFLTAIMSNYLKLQKKEVIISMLSSFAMGVGIIIVPFMVYYAAVGALIPYLKTMLTVVLNMQNVIDPHYVSEYPQNFIEAFWAMINPAHTNFKHMTPSYCYLILCCYFVYRYRQSGLNRRDLFVFCLGIYGFIMYNTGFRGIWAAQFEMALQPSKLVLFFILEVVFLKGCEKKDFYQIASQSKGTLSVFGPVKWKVYVINFLIVGLICSSLGYGLARFKHRFYAFQYVGAWLTGKDTQALLKYKQEPVVPLTLERAKGILVPVDQAQELMAIDAFVNNNMASNEEYFVFPEMGTYFFLTNRPFVGRFAISTFAWFDKGWHQELLEDLKVQAPRYIFVEKNIGDYWKAVYLGPKPNQEKFQDYLDFIEQNYVQIDQTPLSLVYRKR